MFEKVNSSIIKINPKVTFNSPLIIGGFIGQTTLGVTTTSYIIEQFNLHEVAILKSSFIPPVAVFVGGKLRSPFRIYSDKVGKIMVIQCEVPIESDGLYEITEVLMEWLKTFTPKEFVIIDGVPVREFPEEREAFLVAGLDRIKELKEKKLPLAEAAIIAGMGGAILNESIMEDGRAIALLTHVSVSMPDPDAVLAIVKGLNSIYDLDIKTTVLEESVNKIHEEIKKVSDEYRSSIKEGDPDNSPDPMYR
jgi:uncharacterized protein